MDRPIKKSGDRSREGRAWKKRVAGRKPSGLGEEAVDAKAATPAPAGDFIYFEANPLPAMSEAKAAAASSVRGGLHSRTLEGSGVKCVQEEELLRLISIRLCCTPQCSDLTATLKPAAFVLPFRPAHNLGGGWVDEIDTQISQETLGNDENP